jgi:hypothetical protein
VDELTITKVINECDSITVKGLELNRLDGVYWAKPSGAAFQVYYKPHGAPLDKAINEVYSKHDRWKAVNRFIELKEEYRL